MKSTVKGPVPSNYPVTCFQLNGTYIGTEDIDDNSIIVKSMHPGNFGMY